MDLRNVPVVGAVFELGAQDPVLDSILLLGPVVVLGIVLLGRGPLAVTLVALYVLSFAGYVLYNGIRE